MSPEEARVVDAMLAWFDTTDRRWIGPGGLRGLGRHFRLLLGRNIDEQPRLTDAEAYKEFSQ